MIIDTHTHLLDTGDWPNEWWKWVADDWAAQQRGRTPDQVIGRIEAGLIDPDGSRLISQMDGAGVDASVVLPIDWGPDFTGTRPITQTVAHVLDLARRHPGRLIPFAGIDPRREDASRLVAEWIESGARGLKLYPACGWDPVGDDARVIYELCNVAKLPVLFHTGDPLPLMDRDASNPALLSAVAADYPDMPVWLGHAGAPRWWREALTLSERFENVRLELSVWVWDDSTEEAKDILAAHVAEAVASVGARRLLFGSDNVSGRKVRGDDFQKIVLSIYRELPERVLAHGAVLTQEDLALVLGGNARRDLGM
ncbi:MULTISPECIES: amidohydrolase family protein [unclassified Microbacterium]|uniref:amidohydrolase family protein n=1 Tax=unclassified Microbacterium TaxID=2609290 RepID=UPI00214B12FB|nr:MULTISPECIES: amidohydrolase family protein [unclassified Microbacterium]MCR2811322.1 amidohydrolase [Microbacterium sp. zg.B185]WIM19479.1 amidohydrolase family protein [Microbacterium sp. zg-B185]